MVVCVGWMHILSPACLVGARIERAFEAWEKGEIQMFMRGSGRAIVVREVDLGKGNTLSDLEERIHVIGHVEIVNVTGIALEQRRKMAKS